MRDVNNSDVSIACHKIDVSIACSDVNNIDVSEPTTSTSALHATTWTSA